MTIPDADLARVADLIIACLFLAVALIAAEAMSDPNKKRRKRK